MYQLVALVLEFSLVFRSIWVHALRLCMTQTQCYQTVNICMCVKITHSHNVQYHGKFSHGVKFRVSICGRSIYHKNKIITESFNSPVGTTLHIAGCKNKNCENFFCTSKSFPPYSIYMYLYKLTYGQFFHHKLSRDLHLWGCKQRTGVIIKYYYDSHLVGAPYRPNSSATPKTLQLADVHWNPSTCTCIARTLLR